MFLVVVVVRFGVGTYIPCEVTAPFVVFLPLFLPSRTAHFPVLSHCNFKVLCIYIYHISLFIESIRLEKTS